MMAHNAAAATQLQKPCYENIAAIDDRLAELERETSMMEQKYAFIKSASSNIGESRSDVGRVIDAREQAASGYNPHQSNFLSGMDKSALDSRSNILSQTKFGQSTTGFAKESRYNNLPTINADLGQAIPQKLNSMSHFQSDFRNEVG